MTTNRDWLFSLPLEEQYAWMNAERQEQALDGDTAQENADSRDKLEADIRQYANPAGNTGTLGACWERKMLEFIDRQAAITERETKLRELYKFEENHREHIRSLEETNRKLNERIAELTAERDELQAKLNYLKAHGVTISEPFCGGYEVYNEVMRERDELQGQVFTLKCECDDLESTCDDLENELYNVKAERERYRSKFGKCLDYADAIHALMDDEGMA